MRDVFKKVETPPSQKKLGELSDTLAEILKNRSEIRTLTDLQTAVKGITDSLSVVQNQIKETDTNLKDLVASEIKAVSSNVTSGLTDLRSQVKDVSNQVQMVSAKESVNSTQIGVIKQEVNKPIIDKSPMMFDILKERLKEVEKVFPLTDELQGDIKKVNKTIDEIKKQIEQFGASMDVLSSQGRLSQKAIYMINNATGGGGGGLGDMLKATYDPDGDGVIALAQLDTGIASTADIATHTALTTGVHGLGTMAGASSADYLLKQMLENDPLKLDASLSATGKYSGITESVTAGTTLVFGDLAYLLAASSRYMKTLASTATTSNGKLVMCCSTAVAGGTLDVLLYGKISSTTFPAMSIGAPIFISAGTAGYVTGTASSGTTDYCVRIVGYGNSATELFFKPDNTYLEIA